MAASPGNRTLACPNHPPRLHTKTRWHPTAPATSVQFLPGYTAAVLHSRFVPTLTYLMIVKKSSPRTQNPPTCLFAPTQPHKKAPPPKKWGLPTKPTLYFEKIVLPGIFSSLSTNRFCERFAPRIAVVSSFCLPLFPSLSSSPEPRPSIASWEGRAGVLVGSSP